MMKLHLENLQEINDELELKNKDYKIRIKLLLDVKTFLISRKLQS